MELAYYQAKFEALEEIMAADERVHLINGTFLSLSPHRHVYQNLKSKYGERMISPPISELGFCGLATGAAMAGLRPIVDLSTGSVELHEPDGDAEDWRVHLIDTGRHTETGGRMLKIAPYLDDGDTFMMTFGDGVSDVDITKLVEFHRKHGKLATLTAVRPPARFGHVELDGDQVAEFSEKPQLGEGWINGGFFVLSKKVLDYIDGEETHFQKEPLERLAQEGQLMAFKHTSFWQCMDTLRDKILLQQLWDTERAPWKVWR